MATTKYKRVKCHEMPPLLYGRWKATPEGKRNAAAKAKAVGGRSTTKNGYVYVLKTR